MMLIDGEMTSFNKMFKSHYTKINGLEMIFNNLKIHLLLKNEIYKYSQIWSVDWCKEKIFRSSSCTPFLQTCLTGNREWCILNIWPGQDLKMYPSGIWLDNQTFFHRPGLRTNYFEYCKINISKSLQIFKFNI